LLHVYDTSATCPRKLDIQVTDSHIGLNKKVFSCIRIKESL